MKVKEPDYDVGVIVGRFQVPELHSGHIDLIQSVVDRHDKVIIFLGLSPLMVTRENPLDFESRKQMILETFPDVIVLYVKDQYSDEVWSERLDQQIRDVTTASQSVVLYGSRDSFVSHYGGRYPTLELTQEVFYSGTEVRKQIARSVRKTADFRAGVVWAAYSQFPTVYTVVDVAIFNEDATRILLGRKANETQYRLIGGFSDPSSETFEEDARREVQEETGIDITRPEYVGSFKIDDWRYRNEVDCMKSLLFVAKYRSGHTKANDDIAEVRWFDLKLDRDSFVHTPSFETIMPNHRPLLRVAALKAKGWM